jgi:hypothetical protein
MATLDTAAKYREVLLYNRYQAARDNMARFSKEPPYAYVISHLQRDLPTAATLVQKMMLNGIEVHQVTESFRANGRAYPADSWVILMNQPFSPLVKELFEAQQYPELRESPNGPPIRPYDVAGWTLPMQMDVHVDAVTEPIDQAQLARLRKLEKFGWPAGTVSGTGPSIRELTKRTRASRPSMRFWPAAAMPVSPTLRRLRAREGRDDHLRHRSRIASPASPMTIHDDEIIGGRTPELINADKPRLGLYRAWAPAMDEGWSRWILEEFKFTPSRSAMGTSKPVICANGLMRSFC